MCYVFMSLCNLKLVNNYYDIHFFFWHYNVMCLVNWRRLVLDPNVNQSKLIGYSNTVPTVHNFWLQLFLLHSLKIGSYITVTPKVFIQIKSPTGG